MSKLIDLTGRKFGKLTVVRRSSERTKTNARWECTCECGKTTTVPGCKLTSGHTKSCGCGRGWHNHPDTKHGMCSTRLYSIWHGMKQRATNPFNKDAVTYINRGIGICEEWENSFEVFAEWAFSNGYDDNLTIDRKDNNKGYSPCNCRWATVSEQAYNKRGSYRITHEDKVYTVGEFAKKMKVPHWRIRRSARLNRLTGCTITKLT